MISRVAGWTGLKPCATNSHDRVAGWTEPKPCTTWSQSAHRWHRALALSAVLSAIACTSVPAPPAAIRFTVPVPDERVLSSFAVSSNGERLVYSAESAADGRRRLYLRSLGGAGAADHEVPDTIGATTPFFSPDGRSVAYFSRGAIWHRPLFSGGGPVRVVDAPGGSAGGTWTATGWIIFAPLGIRDSWPCARAEARPNGSPS